MNRVPIYVTALGVDSPTLLFVEPSRPGSTVRFMTALPNVRVEFPGDSPFTVSTIEIPRSESGEPKPKRLKVRQDAEPGHYSFDVWVGDSKDPGDYRLAVGTGPQALGEVGITVFQSTEGVGARLVVPAFRGNAQVLLQFQPDPAASGGPGGSTEADASFDLFRKDTGEFLAQVTLPNGVPLMNFILDPGVQGNSVRIKALQEGEVEQTGGTDQIDIVADPLDP